MSIKYSLYYIIVSNTRTFLLLFLIIFHSLFLVILVPTVSLSQFT